VRHRKTAGQDHETQLRTPEKDIFHEQTETAGIYLHADLALKEKALARTTPPDTAPGRYRPPDPLMAFLESL
jgi:hypothetical protein